MQLKHRSDEILVGSLNSAVLVGQLERQGIPTLSCKQTLNTIYVYDYPKIFYSS